MCSWRALLVPPLMQLVHSSNASSLYSTRVLLARTTRIAVHAACAIFARLEPLLDPCFLANTNCSADATACAVSERLGPLLDPGSLAGTNCHADATALFERLEPLLDPCAPGAHYSYRRSCSLCNLCTPRAFTRPVFPGKHELLCRCYGLCSLRTPRAFT